MRLTLLQTPSFPLGFLPIAPTSWLHLTTIPALQHVFLRWQLPHPPSPPGAQRLDHQPLNLLWPICALAQSPTRVPCLSLARYLQISTLHAPPSWPPMSTAMFSEFMTSSTQLFLSERQFAHRTTLEITVCKAPACRLANWMRTPINLIWECLNWWLSSTSKPITVRLHAEMSPLPSYPTWPCILKPIFHSTLSHLLSMQLSCVYHAPARFLRPTWLLSRTSRTDPDSTPARS